MRHGRIGSLALFCLALASPTRASMDVVPTTWLSTVAELSTEFCATEWPLTSDSCTIPLRPAAVMRFPMGLGKIVEAHVRQAARNNYYQTLDMNDFFHGHLIMQGPQTLFRGAEDFFAHVSLILYHTAEYNDRWQDEAQRGIPVERRTPRSLIGYLDGRLTPATDVLRILPPGYAGSGTIYGNDVVAALPWSTSLVYPPVGGVPDIFIDFGEAGKPRLCQVDSQQFYIVPRTDGRFRGPDGAPIEIFIRCVLNTDQSQIVYRTTPRPRPN